MSALTQALVDVGFNARRAEAIEAAITGALPDAGDVAFTPAGNIAATDVQAAIEELDAEKGDVNGPNGGVTDGHAVLFDGVTGKLVKTAGDAPYIVGGTDVVVADGGSGRSSATAYAVICGGTTGTGAHQSIAGVGTSGEVLTSNGAGVLPTFQAVTGGGITTVASGNLSGNAVNITGIPDTYAYLVLQVTGGSFDTGSRQVLVQVSTDNGSSYDTTAGNYLGDYWTGSAMANGSLASLVESSSIGLAAGTFTFAVSIFNHHTGPHKLAEFRYLDSGNTLRGRSWYVGSTNNIDALRIINSGTGNFDAGTYALYGIS